MGEVGVGRWAWAAFPAPRSLPGFRLPRVGKGREGSRRVAWARVWRLGEADRAWAPGWYRCLSSSPWRACRPSPQVEPLGASHVGGSASVSLWAKGEPADSFSPSFSSSFTWPQEGLLDRVRCRQGPGSPECVPREVTFSVRNNAASRDRGKNRWCSCWCFQINFK